MKTSLFTGLIAASLLTLGAAQMAQANDAQKALFADAVSSAKAANKVAKKHGNEWRDTGKMLKKAQAKADKGDLYGGYKIAQAAEFQAHAAVIQAKSQKGTGNPAYLY